jgi:hypothetical protein
MVTIIISEMFIVYLVYGCFCQRIVPFGSVPEVDIAAASKGIFQTISTAPISAIHGALAPKTGKVILLERFDGGLKHSSHSAEFDYHTGYSKTLSTLTDIFCSTGFVAPNLQGTIYNVGGWTGQSLEAVRDYVPCGNPGLFGQCDWHEDPSKALLQLPRWYPSALPLSTGRVAIIGGTDYPTGLAQPSKNQPSVEYLPPLEGDLPIQIQLLVETDQMNLYPNAHLLENGMVFLLAADRAQLLDPLNFELIQELPPIPGGYRTYPYTGSSVLLSLIPANNYQSEILVCGGTSGPNKEAPALDSCGRILPTNLDNPLWNMEKMPMARLMPDMVILADGNILILNGASTGWAGFNSATDPITTAILYYPNAPENERFLELADSPINRLYHSMAILVEDGTVLVLGSSPNANANEIDPQYPDEKRIEVFYPPYLLTGKPRPIIADLETDTVENGEQLDFFVNVDTFDGVIVSLFTNGFVTHSVHQGQRRVELDVAWKSQAPGWYSVAASIPDANIVPPGWYMLFVTKDGVPSIAKWVLVGASDIYENWE